MFIPLTRFQVQRGGSGPIWFLLRRLVYPQDQESTYGTPLPSPTSTNSLLDYQEDSLPSLAHEDFEYLYYMILCKLQNLYRDLQVRFACHFITMNHILHTRGDGGISKGEVWMVQDMRNQILAAWYLFRDETFNYYLNSAIRSRKLSILTGLPLSVLSQPNHNNPLRISGCSSNQQAPIDQHAALRATVQGLVKDTTPVILLDLFHTKYDHSTPEYAPQEASSHVEISLDEELTLTGIDDPFATNDCSIGVSRRPAEPVRFNDFGQVISPLDCVCIGDCDCKFICSLYPSVCICVYRQKALGPSPERLRPHQHMSTFQTPTKSRFSKYSAIPEPLFGTAVFNDMDSTRTDPEDDILLSSTRYAPATSCQASPTGADASRSPMDRYSNTCSHTNQDSMCVERSKQPEGGVDPLSTPNRASRTVSSIYSQLGNFQDKPKQTDVAPTPPPKDPYPRHLRTTVDPTRIHTNSPLASLSSYFEHLDNHNNRLPRHATESDISYRVPFEDEKYFKTTPDLETPRRRHVRYVSAGGQLPLNARESVCAPFDASRDRPGTSQHKHCASQNQRSSTAGHKGSSCPVAPQQSTDLIRSNSPSKVEKKRRSKRWSGLFSRWPHITGN